MNQEIIFAREYNIELPDSVTSIGRNAFANCSNLTSINYPMNWNYASTGLNGSNIFVGCNKLLSITVPEGVTEIPDYAFQGASDLRTINLPGTLQTIGSYAFKECSQLSNVILPDNVTQVNKNAFANCENLEYVLVSNINCTFGDNVLKDSPKAVLRCSMNSMATLYAINNNIPFQVINENISSTGVLDHLSTRYYADLSGVSTNGYVTMTVEYSMPQQKFSTLKKPEITIKLPANAELVESTLKQDGVLSTTHTYNEEKGTLVLPVTKAAGTIKYSARLTGSGSILSYALLTYSIDKEKKQEIIGVTQEKGNVFALYAPELVSNPEVSVEGVAPAQATVTITAGNSSVTATANKAGSYAATVTLPVKGKTMQSFTVSASCRSEGETLTASRTVSYQQDAPELNSFITKVWAHETNPEIIDLYDYSQKGIKPRIFFNPSVPYSYEVSFSHPETIEAVYVTSTRNNIKKTMEAKYDEASGKFIAQGRFDEEDKRYVPGTLGVEYYLKHEKMLVGSPVDWAAEKTRVNTALPGIKVTSKQEGQSLTGSIDFAKTIKSLNDVAMDYAIGIYDEEHGTSIADLDSLASTGYTVMKYLVPGLDDSKYIAYLDMRDPEDILMVVSDGLSVTKQWYSCRLSTANSWDSNFIVLSERADAISNLSTVASVIYKTYGIMKDSQELRDEIMQSSSITDKSYALQQVNELQSDKIAFLLLTTALPLIVAGGPMTAPALAFSAIIGIMSALSDSIWEYRISGIKTGIFPSNYVIDPSGYVTDATTNKPLEGVTATAYWIESDGSDQFFEKKPDANKYGIQWNAKEYEQMNPVSTNWQGYYGWNVPEGWWRVKYEKNGYQTVWSEWLPVPPPQTDVNIKMVSTTNKAM